MIVWQFEMSLFFWSKERHNRRYHFIVNTVNNFVGLIVVSVWAAFKNPTFFILEEENYEVINPLESETYENSILCVPTSTADKVSLHSSDRSVNAG